MALQLMKKAMGGLVRRLMAAPHVPAPLCWAPALKRKPKSHSLQRTGEKKEGKTRPGAGQGKIGLPRRGIMASPGTLDR